MAKKGVLTTADWLTYDEYKKLLNGLHQDKNYFYEAFATLAFCTACRVSDCLALRWSMILNTDKAVLKEKKRGKIRKITFSKSVRKKISELYKLMGRPNVNELVFVNQRTGNPITVQTINHSLKTLKYRYRLSINHFSTHTFRKTFGRYVYEINGHSAESLILLNNILNHTSIETTKRYIGITDEEIGGVFDSIAI